VCYAVLSYAALRCAAPRCAVLIGFAHARTASPVVAGQVLSVQTGHDSAACAMLDGHPLVVLELTRILGQLRIGSVDCLSLF
jgi:hypothetical protein